MPAEKKPSTTLLDVYIPSKKGPGGAIIYGEPFERIEAKRDADVITAAFREFSAKNLEKEKKPSIRKELEQAKQQSKAQHRQREKVKTKDRGVEL